MEQNPKVSVIMNCYNSAPYLREAIDSVYAQTFKDWEIVFLDNASTDESANIAKSYDPKIKYFKEEIKVTLGAARNLALKHVKGEYITFLDCDDVWLPTKLEKQIEIMNSKPEIDFIYSNYIINDQVDNKKRVWTTHPQPSGDVFGAFLSVYPVALLTVMIRKKAVYELPEYFDERLGFAEEYDLFMRILMNHKAEYMSEPLSSYRVHSKMSTLNKMVDNIKEMEYVMEKLVMINPSIKTEYADALKHLQTSNALMYTWYYIMTGDYSAAKQKISYYRFSNLKALFYYFLLNMPRPITDLLWMLRCCLKGSRSQQDVIKQNNK
ncbi:MAG: glycosyltransferase family 2 protein [Elusimicrobia bacterium]|nr:glycosyltransferase family 2 protein [Elusimicrobiota bacterium]